MLNTCPYFLSLLDSVSLAPPDITNTWRLMNGQASHLTLWNMFFGNASHCQKSEACLRMLVLGRKLSWNALPNQEGAPCKYSDWFSLSSKIHFRTLILRVRVRVKSDIVLLKKKSVMFLRPRALANKQIIFGSLTLWCVQWSSIYQKHVVPAGRQLRTTLKLPWLAAVCGLFLSSISLWHKNQWRSLET